MTELRNVEADLSRFRARILVASALVLVAFFLLLSRLVYLQIVRHDDLEEQAESNRTAIVPIVPNRGLILDRNGIVLATNYSAYTLEITPSRVSRSLDQTIDDLAQVIETLHTGMLAVTRAHVDYEERAARLGPILDQAYDLDFMARKALGGSYDKLDAAQQAQWQKAFRTFMIANYAGRLGTDHDQKFESLGEETSAQDTVLVKGRVLEPGADTIDLTYRMRKTNAGWRVIDVYLKGTVSELALRRSDFSAVLEREGFDALLASVDHKLADLAAGRVK